MNSPKVKAADRIGDENVEIELPRPRDYEMRVTPEFNELKLEIWNELKDEITV